MAIDVPMQTAPDHSPNEAVTTESHGITQIVRNFFGGGTRAQDTLLAISIMVNVLLGILLWGAYKHMTTQAWLTQYDFSHFESTQFAELRSEVETDHALIQAFGIANEVRHGRNDHHRK